MNLIAIRLFKSLEKIIWKIPYAWKFQRYHKCYNTATIFANDLYNFSNIFRDVILIRDHCMFDFRSIFNLF